MTRGKIEKLELVKLHASKPPKEIATITGLPIWQVYHYLRKLGVKKTKVDFLPTANELRAEGLNQVALAKRCGVSKATIAKRLRSYEAKSES